MAASFLLVDGTDLAKWADRRDAQARLPQLVRRLIQATMIGRVDSIDVRADEGVSLGGWDGIVQAKSSNAHVPAGLSVWEMGTDSDIKGKADKDYDKRTENPDGVDPKTTTYIFVTPRRWRNKTAWSKSKRAKGEWKDVRAYDADDLATWLEGSPGVHLWVSAMAGKHPGEAEALSTFWENWASVSNPVIHPRLLIAGRADEASGVKNWLASPASPYAVRGENAEEAIAFVAAAVQTLPAAERESVLARAIVVTDMGAWQTLTLSEAPLILIPVFADRSKTPAAAVRGHHVLIPIGRSEPSVGNGIDLPRVSSSERAAALLAMGVEKEMIDELAALSRVSISAVRRKLALHPASLIPQWAGSSAARSLIPAVLCGSWMDDTVGDTDMLARFADTSYKAYCEKLETAARNADPPIRKIGSIWAIAAKEDTWGLIASYVTDEDLITFQEIAIDVLGALDPKCDLPANERIFAAIRGRILPYSRILRESIADTLVMLATTSGVVRLSTKLTGQEIASRIVEILLGNATSWQHWASLSDHLMALAEAAPDEFLEAIERDLRSGAPALPSVFHDAGGMFSVSPHTGLLFSLEALAWNPHYLDSASLILARLARRDSHPSSTLADRPARTLNEIFLLWHPSTMATLDQRLATIDRLIAAEPAVAWRLLCALIPRGMGVSTGTARPARRDWASEDRPRVSRAELDRGRMEVLRRLRALVGSDGTRWQNLIELFENVPEAEYRLLVAQLNGIDASRIDPADRIQIWSALRTQLARHREFSDAEWAIPSTQLQDLDKLYELFAPTDEIERNGWLFGSNPRLPTGGLGDVMQHHKAVLAAQERAIEMIHKGLGLSGVLATARSAELPGTVGAALGRSKVGVEIDVSVLNATLGCDEQSLRVFASGFLHGRRFTHGNAWSEALRRSLAWSSWTPRQRADFYLSLPLSEEMWKLVDEEEPEVRRLHWSERPPIGVLELDTSGIEYVARAFIENRRVATAVDFLAACYHVRRQHLTTQIVLEALESARQLSVRPGDEAALAQEWLGVAHDTSELLNFLDGTIDDQTLARLEWFFLSLVSPYRPAKAFIRNLLRSPELFAELISIVYKPKSGEARQPSDAEQQRAEAAYELLHRFRSLPGRASNGTLDAAELAAWVRKARELAIVADRVEVADEVIGELLAHSPVGEDGMWPHPAIRNLIEEIASKDLEQGIMIGIHNKRGVTTRGTDEGGAQERVIADRYAVYATKMRGQSRRTASLLEKIARSYEHDAERQDLSVDAEEQIRASRRPTRRGSRSITQNPQPSSDHAVDMDTSVSMNSDGGTPVKATQKKGRKPETMGVKKGAPKKAMVKRKTPQPKKASATRRTPKKASATGTPPIKHRPKMPKPKARGERRPRSR